MSEVNEEVTEVETETEEVESEDGTELTNEQLKTLLAKTRREAAGHRVEKQKVKKDLEEFQAWKDSQKTELERALEENAKLKKAQAEVDEEKMKRKLAKEAGLDLDFADRIKGDSEEEMLEDAKRMAEKLPAKAPNGSTASYAGRRGESTTDNAKQSKGAEFLSSLAKNPLF